MPPLTAKALPRGRRRRIGLLGGSFNPAHEGHMYISRVALARLGVSEVWWLVSPQNPLKSRRGMAPFAVRVAAARKAARHPRIRVSGIEAELGTSHTADTLRHLLRRFPETRFVWLMGADNLIQINRWRDWMGIFAAMPVAVFARPNYSLKALASAAARQFAWARMPEAVAGALTERCPPAWAFLHIRPSAASATAIRAKFGRAWPDRLETTRTKRAKTKTKSTPNRKRKKRSRPSRDGRPPKRPRRA